MYLPLRMARKSVTDELMTYSEVSLEKGSEKSRYEGHLWRGRKASWSLKGHLGNDGRGTPAPEARLREMLAWQEPSVFSDLVVWAEGIASLSSREHVTRPQKSATNVKLVPRGLPSLVDTAWQAHGGTGNHSTPLPLELAWAFCVGEEEVGFFTPETSSSHLLFPLLLGEHIPWRYF